MMVPRRRSAPLNGETVERDMCLTSKQSSSTSSSSAVAQMQCTALWQQNVTVTLCSRGDNWSQPVCIDQSAQPTISRLFLSWNQWWISFHLQSIVLFLWFRWGGFVTTVSLLLAFRWTGTCSSQLHSSMGTRGEKETVRRLSSDVKYYYILLQQ